jgi:hypothetical protein
LEIGVLATTVVKQGLETEYGWYVKQLEIEHDVGSFCVNYQMEGPHLAVGV